MEIARMNYKFTAILIILICLLTYFGNPNKAHSKNEYLNEYGVRCGEIDLSVEQRDTDYNYSDSNTHENQNFRLTFRKYLGTDCKTSKENVQIKQQLELMKMCGRVNANPSLALNSNFALLVEKCRGVTPARDNTRPADSQSLWDDLKDQYKKDNPNIKLMEDRFIMPTDKDVKGILPEPVISDEEKAWNDLD